MTLPAPPEKLNPDPPTHPAQGSPQGMKEETEKDAEKGGPDDTTKPNTSIRPKTPPKPKAAHHPVKAAHHPVKAVHRPVKAVHPPQAGHPKQPALSKTVAGKHAPAQAAGHAEKTDRATSSAPISRDEIIKLQREIRHLKFSRDLTRKFLKSSHSMKEVVGTVFLSILDILDAEAGSLWLFSQKENQNICHIAEGPAKDRVLGLRLPPGTGIVGQVIESKCADIVLNCASDPRFDAGVDRRSHFHTHSMICVPIIDEGEALGAIQIVNKKGGVQQRFTEEDSQLVQDLALSADIAVRNARLMEKESRVKEMNALMEISRQIASSLDLGHVMDLVVNLADDFAHLSSTALALLNEDNDRLFIAALSGVEEITPQEPSQVQRLRLMEQVRQGGRDVYVADVETLRKEGNEAQKPWVEYMDLRAVKSVWSTPLRDEEGALGVLWMESETEKFVAGGKTDMLTILANQSTVSIRNASLYQKIPFVDILRSMRDKGHKWATGWRKWTLITLSTTIILYGLHVLPVFRSVSGPCLVEARFGQGVYLRVAGRIEETFVQEGEQVAKGQLLARLDPQPIRLKLIEAESKLAILERQIIEAKASADASAMRRANIERISAEAALKQARFEMAHAEIHAPGDGIILTPRPKELHGRAFSQGSEILRVADPNTFTIMVELPEEDVLDIHEGQSVRGVLRSRPGQGFRGKIIHVGRNFSVPVEALEEGVVDPEPPEGFAAEVSIHESDVDLLPGMTGQASIDTPQTSVVTRAWRRVINFAAFWFGLTLESPPSNPPPQAEEPTPEPEEKPSDPSVAPTEPTTSWQRKPGKLLAHRVP